MEQLWQDADPAFTQVTAAGVRCVLCPFRCRLRDGESGACRVRRRNGGRVQTLTRTTTVHHLDAVERKPFYHFRPGSAVLTLAPPGCSFRCDYCVNHRISGYGREPRARGLPPVEPVDVSAMVRRAAESSAAVGLSYSEPSLAPELTLALAAEARPLGVPVVWKSNGFLTPEAADRLAPALSAVNVDVKAAAEAPHLRLTGAPLAPVLDTLRRLREHGVWLEVTTPLIPGSSASDDELRAIADSVAPVDPRIPWHLVRFTPTHRMTDHPPTGPDRLARAREIGHAAGLRHVYVERALGAEGRATRCPRCAATVVERDVWSLAATRLDGSGRCPECGTTVGGVWR
ncbi:AmmeMemoRadiSam system radical SAM enzyme [Streptomyces sp. NPDC060194]|uniref:AmmeMemoRadiSam system radical SAM enzyme n=1 Tax=Streptomyces sp. NPDC060194 TaxID=3347069 RepID=UPI00366725FC